jgi:hypothetical protein
MKNKQEHGHALDASNGKGRIEYHAPHLVEFGDLAAHTQTFVVGSGTPDTVKNHTSA